MASNQTAIFTVNAYDNLSEMTKEYSIVTIDHDKGTDLGKDTLDGIRKKLIVAKVLSSTLSVNSSHNGLPVSIKLMRILASVALSVLRVVLK